MSHITLSWTIKPASNPIIFLIVASILILTSIIVFSSTKSPFYVRLSIILVSFSYGVILIYSGLSWFFFSLVIIFLGGIIVVFVYASSLGSKFIITFSLDKYSLIAFVITITAIAILICEHVKSPNPIQLIILYRNYSSLFILMIGTVLLLILFVVSKVVAINDGAIKL